LLLTLDSLGPAHHPQRRSAEQHADPDQQSERPLRRATQKGKMCSLRTILSDIIAQCLNLEEEFEHDASKLCIFGFEALK
jgi:hypothetical protein